MDDVLEVALAGTQTDKCGDIFSKLNDHMYGLGYTYQSMPVQIRAIRGKAVVDEVRRMLQVKLKWWVEM